MAKVVVVEDDGLLAKMYVKLLTFEQHDVVVASDGEQAIPTIKKEKPDIVLMDVMMPKMNGLQSLEQLKKDPETAGIPVVVMSNLVNVNDPNEVLARGAVKYVDKSMYDPKKISQLVAEVIGANATQTVSATVPAAQQQVQQAGQTVVTQAAQPATSPQPSNQVQSDQ